MSEPSLIAHYRITGKLGEGGMGAVYRAADTKLNREVAIKVLPAAFAADRDRLARFTREAQVLAALNHPNIATIYGIEDGAIIMELVEGQSPAGPLSPEAALPLIGQLIDALEYAHEKGVVHRDLKPANLKITPEGRLKVLDFGLAKALSTEPSIVGYPESAPTLTMHGSLEGAILGTPAYMSPEQARGQPVDRRADIWAFGVVLYELLTGRVLFQGETVSDTLAAVLRHEIDLSAVPPQFRRLLRVCLERDPRKRLQSIGDARILLEDQPAAVPAPRRGVPLWAAAIPALVALAAIGVAVVHFREAQPPEPAPVRFQIPAPDKTSFGLGMALSPDGRRLAFIATGADGRPMLWVRPLDSVTAQALPGAEAATFTPFWSPDSRSIGFLAEGKLKIIEASGGPPQTLCEVPGVLIGGSWSREGVIVFSGITGGLFRVSQEGGVATRFTTPDESHGEFGHLMPWFLPDGRHFLYLTRTRKPEDRAIYLATLDGKERKRLVSSGQAGAYAPPVAGSEHGHLLFLREGALMALPLDARRFEPAGEPFPVAEQVGNYLSTGFFSVSANGVLAYRNRASAGVSQLVWFDRQGKSLAMLGTPQGNNTGLTFSPDGKRVAVERRDQTGNLDIWVLDVERGIPTRFTFDAAQDISPVWSPDGTRLAFASDRGAAGIYDIYQKDSSGSGNEELLLKSGMSMLPDDWSPDGRYLLYTVTGQKTGSDLWVLPVSAGTPGDRKPMPYLQGPYNEEYGQFSPDGRWIAYTSNESGSNQVFVQSFPAGAGKFQVSAAGGSQPRWRRDGKEIFYLGADARLMAVDVKTAPKFEAGAPKALFDPQVSFGGGFDYFRYNVTPDGKRFLVNSIAIAPEGQAAAPITVVLNWPAALKSAAAH